MIQFNGEEWPTSGRLYPKDAKLEVRTPYNTAKYKSKWRDLCWWHEDKGWVYLSTLPA